MTPRWCVEIIRPQDGVAKLWDRYDSRERAEQITHMLLRHGIHARVVDVEQVEEPEHCGDRRRFLVWACMVGAVPPARVVERIVDELEEQA